MSQDSTINKLAEDSSPKLEPANSAHESNGSDNEGSVDRKDNDQARELKDSTVPNDQQPIQQDLETAHKAPELTSRIDTTLPNTSNPPLLNSRYPHQKATKTHPDHNDDIREALSDTYPPVDASIFGPDEIMSEAELLSPSIPTALERPDFESYYLSYFYEYPYLLTLSPDDHLIDLLYRRVATDIYKKYGSSPKYLIPASKSMTSLQEELVILKTRSIFDIHKRSNRNASGEWSKSGLRYPSFRFEELRSRASYPKQEVALLYSDWSDDDIEIISCVPHSEDTPEILNQKSPQRQREQSVVELDRSNIAKPSHTLDSTDALGFPAIDFTQETTKHVHPYEAGDLDKKIDDFERKFSTIMRGEDSRYNDLSKRLYDSNQNLQAFMKSEESQYKLLSEKLDNTNQNLPALMRDGEISYKNLSKRLDDMNQRLSAFMKNEEGQYKSLSKRFDNIEQNLSDLAARLKDVDKAIDVLKTIPQRVVETIKPDEDAGNKENPLATG